MSFHFLGNGQFAGNGPKMAGGGGKYYKVVENLIPQEPLILQGRVTPQNVGKNRVFRRSDTNRGPIHLWVFTLRNLRCCNGCKKVMLVGKFT